jgi:predicted RNase H-like nuclease
MPHVLGVDACPTGWVGVVLDTAGHFSEAHLAPTIGELARADVEVVAIDIPIGLPDAGARAADVLARRRIGPLRSSVFSAPIREAVECDSYEEANRIQRARTGKGLSKQTWALRTKLLQVDRWLRDTSLRVVEVHPEVTFATMNGGPLAAPKRTWTGHQMRRALLAACGIELPAEFGPAGLAGADDVLDAAAAAWTAHRVASGTAACLPATPETFSDGLACAIWC